MSLAKKLNLKDASPIRVVGRPSGVDLDDVVVTRAAGCPNVLVFARMMADVDARLADVRAAALADDIAWIAYPKAGHLGNDLSRDILWRHLLPTGIQGIRQVAIDEVWSAIRFRPA